MSGNSFGNAFRITSFGESHGEKVGVIIDGCPAGLTLNIEEVQQQLDRRRPGQSKITSPRKEKDQVHFVSGLFEGKTTGTAIMAYVDNSDARSHDYEHLLQAFRPSHADFTYENKYGLRDHRGGGRASARETVARVIAGAVARQILKLGGIDLGAYVSQVGSLCVKKNFEELDLSAVEAHPTRCPESELAGKMAELIEAVRGRGDTIGGVVTGWVRGCPVGLGDPVFDKLQADLAKAMLSLPAAHGFDYGSGFAGAAMLGSEHNDLFIRAQSSKNPSGSPQICTKTNHSGGIQGGISNGMPIYFRVAFKPVATISQVQDTVDKKGNAVKIEGRGRHDPCVVPRAVPIVEAMTALVLVDHLLRQRMVKL